MVIGTNSDKVVAFAGFKLHMSNIGLKLEPNPKAILVLFRIGLIKVPQIIDISRTRLINNLLGNSFTRLRILPHHHLHSLAMT
jgi:hypothetical protein